MKQAYKTQFSSKKVTIFDDGRVCGLFAPSSVLSAEKLQEALDYLSDINEIPKIHEEYNNAKKNNSFVSSESIEKSLEL
jgi:hypothetical protein